MKRNAFTDQSDQPAWHISQRSCRPCTSIGVTIELCPKNIGGLSSYLTSPSNTNCSALQVLIAMEDVRALSTWRRTDCWSQLSTISNFRVTIRRTHTRRDAAKFRLNSQPLTQPQPQCHHRMASSRALYVESPGFESPRLYDFPYFLHANVVITS